MSKSASQPARTAGEGPDVVTRRSAERDMVAVPAAQLAISRYDMTKWRHAGARRRRSG